MDALFAVRHLGPFDLKGYRSTMQRTRERRKLVQLVQERMIEANRFEKRILKRRVQGAFGKAMYFIRKARHVQEMQARLAFGLNICAISG